MEMMISVRAEAFLARIAGTPEKLHANLRAAVERLSIIVQTGVKEDRLTGQVLRVRTGTLRRSINRVVTEDASGVFATVGTNVKYAAAHEYGFDGIVNVRAHTRRSQAQLALKGKLRPGKSAGEVQVRESARHMVLPERSFLRSELRQRAPEIRESLRQATLRALRGEDAR